MGSSNLVFRSFFLLAVQSIALTRPLSVRGPKRWCPLKTTPTGRPAARASKMVKGDRPDRTAEHKKKDHENQK